ncbi:DivIVA domain-containing protein [Natroniella sulfidigena]|uniref:DivIVA domain-containing protein n=1 Tax=Natroniella sulfidigena TaxID=723921 RepID=UPI00200B3026|nr:DivIVA domain-containing protein [Natroniella sulfidigena]MCK8817710.1 DivIVA domain-containing protein [Natroniella sulfidigena]
MSLTPADIYNKEFDKTFSIFSYDQQEVDDFLDLVAAYYEEVLNEKNSLKLKVKKLETEIEEYQEKDKKLHETIDKAQQTIENRKTEAEKEADLILEEARLEAKKIKEEAKSKAEKKYQQYRELIEQERLFKIKFKTLLKSHLEMLDQQAGLEQIKEEIDFETSE